MSEFHAELGGVIYTGVVNHADQTVIVQAKFMGPDGPMYLRRRQQLTLGDQTRKAFEEAVLILAPQVDRKLNDILGEDLLAADPVIDAALLKERMIRAEAERIADEKAQADAIEERAMVESNPLWGQF